MGHNPHRQRTKDSRRRKTETLDKSRQRNDSQYPPRSFRWDWGGDDDKDERESFPFRLLALMLLLGAALWFGKDYIAAAWVALTT